MKFMYTVKKKIYITEGEFDAIAYAYCCEIGNVDTKANGVVYFT